MNKRLTLLGIERKLFFFLLAIGVAVFNLFGGLLPAVLLFLFLLFLARVGFEADPQILQILINSSRLAACYDPGKWSPTWIQKGGAAHDGSADRAV